MELLDSNNQWRDGQRRRNDNGMNSSIKSENDYNGKGRRHRKNRYFILDSASINANRLHAIKSYRITKILFKLHI